MAKQKSIIKLEGTIGDISFYKSKDGYLAREKGGITASRVATEDAFQRTRENGAEFGRAAKTGKLLRKALKTVIAQTADNGMCPRLATQMLRVLQADQVSDRGQRNILDGELELLSGFEFNQNGQVGSTIFVPFVGTINRETGEVSATFPVFNPATELLRVPGATHFKLKAAGSEIDFEAGTYVTSTNSSEVLPVNAVTDAPIVLDCPLPPASDHPLFLAVGIEFFQRVNGKDYMLSNGSYNGLSLVKISGLKAS